MESNPEGGRRRRSVQDSIFQDTLLSCVASLFSILLVRWVSEPSFGFTRHVLFFLTGAFLFTLLGLLLTGGFRFVGTNESFWTGRRLAYTVIIKELCMFILMLTGVIGKQVLAHMLLAVMSDAIFTMALLIYPRALISRIRKEDREMRSLPDRSNALVFGDDEAAAALAENAAQSGRYEVLGLLSRNPEMGGKIIREFVIYYVGDEEDFERLQWRLGGVDCILFPKGGGFGPTCHLDSGSGKKAGTLEMKDNMSKAGKFLKRSFDIGLSSILLLVFSPLIGICALAVYLEDGRPVLYRQERMGLGGKPFNILKFRSMRLDAEAAGPALYSGDEDPRLTRVGKFLRQHHLDELPQLWNVLCGDMSFIGYRPERQFYIDQIMAVNPRYRYLYQIRPGVTSYATLYNGYTDSLEKMLTRLDLDLFYLRHHSVWFDARILGLTFLSIVGGKKF
jgi:lipopolysaccharide/colanic/teichoic acid biosynthesis glycosyltransferase